jgi:hypothetical protein
MDAPNGEWADTSAFLVDCVIYETVWKCEMVPGAESNHRHCDFQSHLKRLFISALGFSRLSTLVVDINGLAIICLYPRQQKTP